MGKLIYIGDMDRKVGVYQYTDVKTTTGETAKTEVLLKNTWAKAEEVSSSESEEEKVYLINVRNYTIRYNETIYQSGQEMFIRDLDGDYNVIGVQLQGRKAFLKLKCLKRE
jgi:head-tail adaptor